MTMYGASEDAAPGQAVLSAAGEDDLLREAAVAARAYIAGLVDAPARAPDADASLAELAGPLPEDGAGAATALAELAAVGNEAAVRSAGPRFFHFVVGGATPAALAADWLTSAYDQHAFAWVSSPLATQLELTALSWLKELCELPERWSGVFTTGATMANFVGLAAARQWWGERHGLDAATDGLRAAPPVPVFSSGYVHSTAVKALSMLGVGRAALRTFSRDGAGRLDLAALEQALDDLDGAPAILIGNAGEVNAGDFDPLESLAQLAERFGCWLHVDAAFGLFARVTPRASALAGGVERADSLASDAHKWLNVPYDCGFAFVAEPRYLAQVFALEAAYLPARRDPRPTLGYLTPESSRRARGLPVWATLRAYGRTGYRRLVERHLELAKRLAKLVEEAPDFELLADCQLNIVCFRYRPPGWPADDLDALNRALGAEVLEDGRVYLGTTVYDGKVAFRPAIVNWRTTAADVESIIDVLRELGRSLTANITS